MIFEIRFRYSVFCSGVAKSELAKRQKLYPASLFDRLSFAYRFGQGKYRSEIEILPLSIYNSKRESFDSTGMQILIAEQSNFEFSMRYILFRQVLKKDNVSASIGFSQRAGYSSRRFSHMDNLNSSWIRKSRSYFLTSSFVPSIYYSINERLGIEFNLEFPFLILLWDEDSTQISQRRHKNSYFETYDFTTLYDRLYFRVGLGYVL